MQMPEQRQQLFLPPQVETQLVNGVGDENLVSSLIVTHRRSKQRSHESPLRQPIAELLGHDWYDPILRRAIDQLRQAIGVRIKMDLHDRGLRLRGTRRTGRGERSQVAKTYDCSGRSRLFQKSTSIRVSCHRLISSIVDKSRSQSLTTPSLPQVAASLPSGEIANPHTASSLPIALPSSLPFAASRI